MSPVVGTVLVIGLVVVCSAAVGAFVLQLGAELGGDATAAVEVTTVEPADGRGFAVVTALTLARADGVTVTATADAADLRDPDGSATDEVTGRLESAGDSIAIRGDAASAIDVRIVAIAERGERRAVVLDRTVTV